jgi:CRISPR-associated protein Csm3
MACLKDKEPGRIAMSTFEMFESRTLISATLEMQTALCVGSRASLEPTGTDLPVIKDQKGVPFVPGSSIKGIIRSEMERVLRSLGSLHTNTMKLCACDPFGKQCISADDRDDINKAVDTLLEKKQIKEEDREAELSKMIWNKSCNVCNLFGSPWLASRLAFKDAFLTNLQDMAEITSIRDGVGIDRDRGAAKDGFKYDFEAVSSGAKFGIVIIGENIERWEIGLLLSVLRPWQEGYLSIGGKSSRGPGWGKLAEISIQRVEKTDLLKYFIDGEMTIVSCESVARSLKDHLLSGGIQYA